MNNPDMFVVSYRQLNSKGTDFVTWRTWFRCIKRATSYGLALLKEGRHNVTVWKDERD